MTKTTVFHAVRPVGKSHVSSILETAEQGIKLGLIARIPVVTYEAAPNKLGLYKVSISHPECDRAFWFAFYRGIAFTRANRQCVLGMDE